MTIFDGKIDDPRHVPTFVAEATIFGVAGLLLGVIVDKQFKSLTKKYPKAKYLIGLAQFVTLALIISIMYIFVKHEFASHFQVTLTGMTFPAMYFGVQSNLFELAQGTPFSWGVV